MVPLVLQRPDVWEVPVSTSYAFWMISLLLVWRQVNLARSSLGPLFCLGAAVGLAVGCRPSTALGMAILAVPLAWEFLRQRGPNRARKVLGAVAAVSLPIIGIGVVLAAYNHARFGDAFEFGQKYQLNNEVATKADYFRLRFFWYDFRMYFLEYPGWQRAFPFVRDLNPPSAPAGHGGDGGTVGLFTLLPFTLVALAVAPLRLRAQGVREPRRPGRDLVRGRNPVPGDRRAALLLLRRGEPLPDGVRSGARPPGRDWTFRA